MMTSGNRNQGHHHGGGNSGQGQGNQTVSTPTFVPSSGSFVNSVQVAIVCATPNATIRYTLDGSQPTGLSPVYTSPLTLTETKTVKAIASKNGYVTSAVGQVTLTVTYAPLPAVTFSPAAGHYEEIELLVTLSNAVPGVTIHYTTTGDTPTTSSSVYTGPFSLLPEMDPITVKAIAVKTGWNNSPVATAIYDLVAPTAPAPTFSPLPGNYISQASVTISTTLVGMGEEIHYEVGNIGVTPDPTPSSTTYTEPVVITTDQTLKAIVVASGYNNSPVTSGNYTRQSAAPTIAPDSGTYYGSVEVTVTNNEPSAIVYYTTDGSDPTSENAQYSGPVNVVATCVFKARAIAFDQFASAIVSKSYTVAPPLPTVVLSNPGLNWTGPPGDRGSLTMDFVTTHGSYPSAYVEFVWSTDGINYSSPGEYEVSSGSTWVQMDLADQTAIPETFYMKARYISENNPSPTLTGPWSNVLTWNTGDYPTP